MRNLCVCVALVCVIFCGCWPEKDPPPVEPATELPTFANQENEIEIADSMNDVDPTWVLGSIVDVKTGRVHSLNNCLSKTAKPLVKPETEEIFRDLMENSIALNAGYLDFLKGKLSDTVMAELTVVKASTVTMKNEDVDEQKLATELEKIPTQKRDDYGLVIGYINFVLSARLYKEFKGEIGASGYGAKVGGSWFTRSEDVSVHHRVVAAYAPLPFVEQEIAAKADPKSDLAAATLKNIKEGKLVIKPIKQPVPFTQYLQHRRAALPPSLGANVRDRLPSHPDLPGNVSRRENP